jgi:transposase InsO family protein
MAECAGIGDIEKARMLALIVKKSFGDSNETYGYRRVHADLVAWGVQAGLELVRSLMRELGLEPCQPKPWRFSLTEGDGQEHDIPDLVNRGFTADAPGEKMADDITCIFTWQGWIYLATVIDCYTKAVIGRAIDDNYKTPLIQQLSRWPHVTILLLRRLYSILTAAVTTRPVSSRRRWGVAIQQAWKPLKRI